MDFGSESDDLLFISADSLVFLGDALFEAVNLLIFGLQACLVSFVLYLSLALELDDLLSEVAFIWPDNHVTGFNSFTILRLDWFFA